jgi:hypothetical protein
LQFLGRGTSHILTWLLYPHSGGFAILQEGRRKQRLRGMSPQFDFNIVSIRSISCQTETIQCYFVCLDGFIRPLKCLHRELLYVSLRSHVVVDHIVAFVLRFPSFQLVHKCCCVGHGLIAFGMQSLLQYQLDDVVAAYMYLW